MSQLNLFEGIDNKEFIEYHKTNPHLYEAFKEIALKSKAMGFAHYGANGIFEIIRWKTAEKGDGEFKINNNFAPLFARLFDNEFPEHKGFFRMRRSKFSQYTEALPKKKYFQDYELVFPYAGNLVILKITPGESDWWTTLNVTDGNGNQIYFDVHYCENYNQICVYRHSKQSTNELVFQTPLKPKQ